MKILGIDPGTVVMGYGVIESEDDETALIDYGALVGPERSEIGERLSHLYNELQEIIERHKPDAVAVEQPFISKNVRSAMAIGRAQAIALLAAARRNIPTLRVHTGADKAEGSQLRRQQQGANPGDGQTPVRPCRGPATE